MTSRAAIDWRLLNARGGLTIGDLPEVGNDGVRMELIDGSLVATPLGDLEHQALATRYAALLLGERLPQGCIAVAGVNVVAGDQTLIIPDVAVVDPQCAVRAGLGASPQGLKLAVEFSSPSTRRHDLTTKRELYREWGVPYLIVDRSTSPATLRVDGDLPDFATVLVPLK